MIRLPRLQGCQGHGSTPQTTREVTSIARASILAYKHLDSIASVKQRLVPAFDSPRPD